MNNCWRDFCPGPDPPRRVYAIIEVTRGSGNKVEYDCDTGFFRLDRVLYSSNRFPTDYGLIPRTWWFDSDPLDVVVLTTNPTFTGCIMVVRPVGMLNTEDEAGDDPKIIAVPAEDPRFKDVSDLSQLPHHSLIEIEDFFLNYKKLEPKKMVRIKGWDNAKKAEETILTGIRLYDEKFKDSA